MITIFKEDQRRWVECLQVQRQEEHGGKHLASPFPDLVDVKLVAFGTVRGMMVAGFEEIDGARYYQSWYIAWE